MFYIFLSYNFSYGRRLKFVRAELSATAEGENCTYGATLLTTPEQPGRNIIYQNLRVTKSLLS